MTLPPIQPLAVLSCRDSTLYGVGPMVILPPGQPYPIQSQQVRPDDQHKFDGVAHFLLLVHGYNDPPWFASSAYTKFLANIASQATTAPALHVVELHWPGNAGNALKSDVDFSGSVHHAMATAEKLAAYLNGLAEKLNGARLLVDVVAHSLGNRVMLETMRLLAADNRGVDFGSFVLMAAAVNVKNVEPGAALNAPALTPRLTAVFHSTSDMVLAIAAPAGETLTGEGFFPEAVGRHGKPFHVCWQYETSFDGFGHSCYWPGMTSAASAGRAIGVAMPNALVEAIIPDYVPPPPNSTPSNTIAARTLGGGTADQDKGALKRACRDSLRATA